MHESSTEKVNTCSCSCCGCRSGRCNRWTGIGTEQSVISQKMESGKGRRWMNHRVFCSWARDRAQSVWMWMHRMHRNFRHSRSSYFNIKWSDSSNSQPIIRNILDCSILSRRVNIASQTENNRSNMLLNIVRMKFKDYIPITVTFKIFSNFLPKSLYS